MPVLQQQIQQFTQAMDQTNEEDHVDALGAVCAPRPMIYIAW